MLFVSIEFINVALCRRLL